MKILLLSVLYIIYLSSTVGAEFVPEIITDDIQAATNIAVDSEGSGRIFITEQPGRLRIVENDELLSTPALTLQVDSDGERGLLGVAFHPQFTTNNYVYLYYTRKDTPQNRISRFTLDGNIIDPDTENIIFDLDPLSEATNHNGGSIHFDSNGKLFIGVGENAKPSNAQLLENTLGKILRINDDGTIPTDNPFYTTATGNNRAIYALGLRNPYTFAISESNHIFVNDVGQDTYEEINDVIAGKNYGWPEQEGPNKNSASVYTEPFLYYGRNENQCSISGGTFYNSSTYPEEFKSVYFYSDYCAGYVRYVNLDTKSISTLDTGITNPIGMAVSKDGRLLSLARKSLVVYSYKSEITTPSPSSTTTSTTTSTATSTTSPITTETATASTTTAEPTNIPTILPTTLLPRHFSKRTGKTTVKGLLLTDTDYISTKVNISESDVYDVYIHARASGDMEVILQLDGQECDVGFHANVGRKIQVYKVSMEFSKGENTIKITAFGDCGVEIQKVVIR